MHFWYTTHSMLDRNMCIVETIHENCVSWRVGINILLDRDNSHSRAVAITLSPSRNHGHVVSVTPSRSRRHDHTTTVTRSHSCDHGHGERVHAPYWRLVSMIFILCIMDSGHKYCVSCIPGIKYNVLRIKNKMKYKLYIMNTRQVVVLWILMVHQRSGMNNIIWQTDIYINRTYYVTSE